MSAAGGGAGDRRQTLVAVGDRRRQEVNGDGDTRQTEVAAGGRRRR